MRTKVALVAALLVLAGCGSAPIEYACATTDVPPVALDTSRCPADPKDGSERDGARWYWALQSDVQEPDERPVVDQPLDPDWWDAADRHEPLTKPKPRVTTKPKAPAKPKVATTATRAPAKARA